MMVWVSKDILITRHFLNNLRLDLSVVVLNKNNYYINPMVLK